MPMIHGGLAKLVEECGELVQVAAKKIAYPTGPHPDGAGDLDARLSDELADVLAAVEFVIEKRALARRRIMERRRAKIDLFQKWDSSE